MSSRQNGVGVRGTTRERVYRLIGMVAMFATLVVLALSPAIAAAAPVAPAATLYGSVVASEGINDRNGAGVSGLIEPGAGAWHTWVLTSGSQVAPPAPPDRVASLAEIQVLKQLAQQRDAAILGRIAYWNSGAPVYRWNELALAETTGAGMNTLMTGRNLALINAAISDATIAAWDAKYEHLRRRPSQLDRTLTTVIPVPASPSYPSEHAVAAGAASEVLAYLFPAKADFFREKAVEAGDAFLSAGVNYPSDVEAGLALGRQVGALVIERGMSDGSNLPWTGTVPTEPGKWTGQNPVLPQAAKWKTWVLTSGSEFRPGPPPAYNSPQLAAEMAELKAYQRTPRTNTLAFFWEFGAGGTRNYWFWNQHLGAKHFEYGLANNPPRAARAYALLSVAYHDSVVACWDAKYAYWAIRPFQVDPTFTTLFTTPNHPSYPSAHSCFSATSADVLAYLFPHSAASINALADEAGESRIWSGLHFRSDITAGLALGQDVAAKAMSMVQGDDH